MKSGQRMLGVAVEAMQQHRRRPLSDIAAYRYHEPARDSRSCGIKIPGNLSITQSSGSVAVLLNICDDLKERGLTEHDPSEDRP